MGVPKFYRWLSERYPQINQILSDTSLLPEFDNFYLDMNGIIHACTHPNDNGTSSSLSLREMMLAIFRYIDRMVTEIVKPKKVLFMAIDGCAPRAKLNQQRARRFRAAQDRTDALTKMKQRGDVVDESSLFDSNCITPGTEFMDTVSRHIKWFIRKKIKEDPLWKNLEIVFSGHDVPGEGEHKIMQFIREMKARPDYAPNQRHCMYGQDADLIMLGLASHEPHFSLLREVVEFATRFKGSTRQTVIRQTREVQFQLLHLSVLREYIQVDLGLGLNWVVDPERLYDDFILLTFLVGNDFLPHLPTLDISEHAFDVVFDAYKDVLNAKESGYITMNGEISDIGALEKLFSIIGEQEREILRNRETESMAYLAKRRKWAEEEMPTEEEIEEAEEVQRKAYEDAIQEALGNGGTSDEVEYPGEKDHRGLYYFEKFKIITRSAKSKEFFNSLRESYLQGLSWCLAYYIKGCISWTWYYPYHYGPMLQDMKNLSPILNRIKFDLGKPFQPFQQLLGCLPPASKSLLPRPYQWLMTNENSPMISDYPEEFGIDMDGKKNPWEAVVLLGFIDEKRLFESEAIYCKAEMLTDDEKARNKFGAVLTHRFDPKVFTTYFSCNPEIGLPDITKCQSEVTFSMPDLKPGASFKPELVPGTITPIAGFPSLTVLQISKVDIDFYKCNVFGTESKYRTLTLEIFSQAIDLDKVDLKTLLGRIVYVNYPMMHEARVVGITTAAGEYRLINNGEEVSFMKYDLVSSELWKKESVLESLKYLKGRTTPGSSGLNIGDIQIRLRVQALQGMKRDPITGASTKVYNTSEADVPIQLALWNAITVDPRFQEQEVSPVEKLMPYGCDVVAVKGPLLGCLGKVIGPHTAEDSKKLSKDSATNLAKRVVDIEFSIPPAEPPFGHLIADSIKEEYFSSQDVCSALKVSPNVMGKIVGSLIIDKEDVGLNLKRNGHFQLLGYVRRVDHDSEQSWGAKDTVVIIGTVVGSEEEEEVSSCLWQYSAKAVALLVDYKTKFPTIFEKLKTLPHQKKYTSTEIFGRNSASMVDKVLEWMKAQTFYKMPRTPFTTTSLSKEAMNAIERAEDMRVSFIASSGVVKKVVKDVSLDSLFRGDNSSPSDAALSYNISRPRLGDRVVNLNSTGVPFGLRGTVVAIHNSTAYVEVIFDEEFTGGRGLEGNCSPFRGRLCPWAGLLKVSAESDKDKGIQKKDNSESKKNNKFNAHVRGQGPEEVKYKGKEPNKPGLVSEIGNLIAQKSNIPTGTVTITKVEKPKVKKIKPEVSSTKSEEKMANNDSIKIEEKNSTTTATTNMTDAFKILFNSMSKPKSSTEEAPKTSTTNITNLLKNKLKLDDSAPKEKSSTDGKDPTRLLAKLKKISTKEPTDASPTTKKSGFSGIKIHKKPYVDATQESQMPPQPPAAVMGAQMPIYMPVPYIIPIMTPQDPSVNPIPITPIVTRNTLSAARNNNVKPDWEEDDLDLTKELDLEQIKKNNKSDKGGSGFSFLKQAAEGK